MLTLPGPGGSGGGGGKWEFQWADFARLCLFPADWKERSLSSVEYCVSFSF